MSRESENAARKRPQDQRGRASRRLGDCRHVMGTSRERANNLDSWRAFGFICGNALALFRAGRYRIPCKQGFAVWPDCTVEVALGNKESAARLMIEGLINECDDPSIGEAIEEAIAAGMHAGEAWTEKNRKLVSDDEVARRLGVTAAERRDLGLRTVGAIDATREERQEEARDRKRQRDRARAHHKRRAAGKMTRQEYESRSTAGIKPWEAMGVSRRTYYRRLNANPQDGTSESPHYCWINGLATDLCHVVVDAVRWSTYRWSEGVILNKHLHDCLFRT